MTRKVTLQSRKRVAHTQPQPETADTATTNHSTTKWPPPPQKLCQQTKELWLHEGKSEPPEMEPSLHSLLPLQCPLEFQDSS